MLLNISAPDFSIIENGFTDGHFNTTTSKINFAVPINMQSLRDFSVSNVTFPAELKPGVIQEGITLIKYEKERMVDVRYRHVARDERINLPTDKRTEGTILVNLPTDITITDLTKLLKTKSSCVCMKLA